MREATKEERESVDNYIKSISQKVITIPDNATNGDVIKALFPNSRVDISCARAFFYIREDLKRFVTFDIDWWNAPYQEGDK